MRKYSMKKRKKAKTWETVSREYFSSDGDSIAISLTQRNRRIRSKIRKHLVWKLVPGLKHSKTTLRNGVCIYEVNINEEKYDLNNNESSGKFLNNYIFKNKIKNNIRTVKKTSKAPVFRFFRHNANSYRAPHATHRLLRSTVSFSHDDGSDSGGSDGPSSDPDASKPLSWRRPLPFARLPGLNSPCLYSPKRKRNLAHVWPVSTRSLCVAFWRSCAA